MTCFLYAISLKSVLDGTYGYVPIVHWIAALVGQLGTQQLGAVSVGSLAVSFCTFLFSFLLFLTTPEIAGAVAKKDADKVISDQRFRLW